MRSILVVVIILVPLCAGCGGASSPKKAERGMAPVDMAMAKDDGKRFDRDAPKAEAPGGQVFHQGAENAQPKPPAQGQDNKAKGEQQRKIKYNANLDVVVDDFDKAWQGLKDAIKDAKGFAAQEDINSSAGAQRLGTWSVRVPVANLHSFRDAVVQLGKPDRNTLKSEDITAEFYDLDAYIKNKHVEREATRKLLEKTGDRDLEAFFRVKRELDNITTDINVKEGQLRLWTNLTDLSTVTINLREKRKIGDADQKPKDQVEPTFGERAGRTWEGTLDLFVGFWQGVAILAIAVTPWLPFPIVGVLLLWFSYRIVIRMTATPVPTVKPTDEKKHQKSEPEA